MGREATEDVVEVREGVDVVVPATSGQGVQDGRRPATSVTPQKRPIPPADRLGAEHPLGEIVIDAQLPVLRIPQQRRPVGGRMVTLYVSPWTPIS